MSSAIAPREIKVVVVAFYHEGGDGEPLQGELKSWIERYGLSTRIPFPPGEHDLYGDDRGVLGFAAGIGANTAAATTMALGLDPRFDLTKAYWLIAGVGGADPAVMTIGGVALARWVIDADKKHLLDPREMPADWRFGTTPYGNTGQEFPVPPEDQYGSVIALNDGLANWALAITRDLDLAAFVTERDKAHCARFVDDGAARRPPAVVLGEILAGDNFWHGRRLNDWARAWVDYWTRGAGRFAIACCEDCGMLTALLLLDKAGRVEFPRVIASRAASNFTCQWHGATAGESLATEDIVELSSLDTALESSYAVGSTIIDELLRDWPRYRDQVPSA